MAEDTPQQPGQSQVVNELVRRIKDFNLRIRELEESLENLSSRVNTIEDAMLEKTRDLKQGQHEQRDELEELSEEISTLQTKLETLQGKTRKMVTRREFSEIEHYIDLLDPVKSQFVTEDDVEDVVEEKVKALKGSREK